MADGAREPKMNRNEFMEFIQIHCLHEVDDEEKSTNALREMIRRIGRIRGREPSVDVNTLDRKMLCKYLQELCSPRIFDYDYDPTTLSDDCVFSNSKGWHFYISKSGTKREVRSPPEMPVGHKAKARDEKIYTPDFMESYESLGITSKKYIDHYLATRMRFGVEYSAHNLHTIEFWGYIHTMAFQSLPIRFTSEEVREKYPQPDDIHPEATHY